MRFSFKKICCFLVVLTITVWSLVLSTSGEENVSFANADISKEVYVGGYPVGIYLKYEGVMVAKVGSFANNQSITVSPSKDILKSGDIILAVNGVEVSDKLKFNEAIEQSGGNDVILKILRGTEKINVKICPELDKEQKAKIGIWVRDDTQGLGTVTYISQDGNFGALGHGVNDIDSGNIIKIMEGTIYEATLIGVKKGRTGSPGEFVGAINYNSECKLGCVTNNNVTGIYGKVDKIPDNLEFVKICPKYNIKKGEAHIISYVDGTKKSYEIEILNMDYSAGNINKGIEFKVTDEELLKITNGIVQGMSGSPIIQEGKIIGSVTHVLVNDPTRGYGIFIESMLNNGN